MPAAASQLGLQWQLQQQGGSGRAELIPAPCVSLQLPSLIGKLPPKLMINACACVASSSSLATASPPARPLCDAVPARPCCNTSRALGGAWNYLRAPGFELFFRAAAGPAPPRWIIYGQCHAPPAPKAAAPRFWASGKQQCCAT